MARDTLGDVFGDLTSISGEFLVYDDGYRIHSRSYADVGRAARALAGRLARAGLRQGDRMVLWGENRPEWIVALWGALLSGVVVVPVDCRSSLDFVRSIRRIVDGRLVLAGDDVPAEAGGGDAASKELDGAPIWRLADLDWRDVGDAPRVTLAGTDTAEIIFTSGATAEPKGVVLTHRNILANIVPIEREIARYRAYGRPFRPIRFLNLLPLSHMFGQAMATFIPPMLAGTTVFMRSYNPHDIVGLIRRRRVSVLVSVPKILDVLREHLRHAAPSTARPAGAPMHWTRRWWVHRDAHRLLGWKFWSAVVGAAPLDPSLEAFWGQLGFVVIQGYGLTETAPVVTLNHPFASRRGSVGKPIHGLEIKLAPDGEIFVRGDNVTQGYFNAPEATAAAFEDGWFRTGDVGEMDDSGRLYVRGRKKEMIVLPDGLNVFPDDVERALNAVPGVQDSAVVGLGDRSGERVHAVLVLDTGVSVHDVVRLANAGLADHQRIRTAAAWSGDRLPRTEGTRKLKRLEIKRWAQSGQAASEAPAAGGALESLLGRFAHGTAVGPDTSLDDLGLSSLERVELMVALEHRFQTSIDESTFAAARNLHDLQGLIDTARPAPDAPEGARDSVAFPAWNRRAPARWIRRIVLAGLVRPFTRLFARTTVEGLEHLEQIDGPVVFASNHQSHMDTPVLLTALPAGWRHQVAPAMAKEFFKAHFHPAGYGWRDRWASSVLYYLAALCFNAFPLPQRETGARDTLRYIGDLAADGYSVLIFPEGERAESGTLKPFRAGVGMIGSRLGLPVVPIRLEGVDRVLQTGWTMPRPGRVRVRFGSPVTLKGDDYAGLARQVEEAVRAL